MFTVTDPDGKPFSTPHAPRSLQERKERVQKETPEQVQKRADYLEKLKRQNPSGGSNTP